MSPMMSRSLAAAVLLLGGVGGAVSQAGDCPCPPPYVHCMEKPPCIVYKCTCPRPVCDPCHLEHWGYYPTCWRRWPGNWANCPGRSPPWITMGPDYLIPENAPKPPEVMLPVMPPGGPQTNPGPDEEGPAPKPVTPRLEQIKYQKYAAPQVARPRLTLYTGPQGN